MTKALLVIDVQNDYFPGGLFPLWNTDLILNNIERAITQAHTQGFPVIIIQHIAKPGPELAPFFNSGTSGADIHPRILAAAPQAPVVVKHFADSFVKTTLEDTLQRHAVTELLVCGMMTQNCVTHTAISRSAEKYHTAVLTDCTTTVNELLHNIALHAVSTRMVLTTSTEAISG